MNNISKLITTFTVCKFLEEMADPQNTTDPLDALVAFSEECDSLGGDSVLFSELAARELEACRLLEQDGGGGAAPVSGTPANTTAGVAGLKPDDIGIPVETQKRHTSRNSIFRRKKPNKYFTDKENSY